MTKIIIFNGPKDCGKDTAAVIVQNYLSDDVVAHCKFSKPLKTIVSNFLNIEPWQLEAQKKGAGGQEFRDLQIGVYESLSRVFGSNWLGVQVCHNIEEQECDNIVMSDGGRPEDVEPLIRKYGGKNIMICQIIRNGCNFDYDIRGYISDGRVVMRHVTNDDLTAFKAKIIDIATEFFAEN